MADNQAMTYMAKIGVDGSEFTGGLEKMAQGFTAMFGPTGIAVGAIAVTTSAIANLIQEQGKIATANLDMADSTGIAVEEIQRFHYAAKITGNEISMVDSMLNKLTLSMGAARDATSSQAAAFAELGIDPTGKSTEEVFTELATALTNMSDKQQMASLATDILGKSYKDSVPYMIDYLENQKEIAEQEVFTKEQEEALERGSRAFEKIGAKAEGFAGWVAIGLVEGAEELTYLLTHGESSILAAQREAKVNNVTMGKENIYPQQEFYGISDPYAGWTAAEVELQLQTDKVTESQKALEIAMGKTQTQENIDAVKELSAAYIEQKQILQDLIGVTEAAAQTALNPYYDAGAIENQGITDGGTISAMMQAGAGYGMAESSQEKYRKVTAAFAMANASTDTSNSYLNQLRALSSEAASSGTGNGYDWSHTSSASSISDRTLSALSAYESSVAPVNNTVIVNVAPDFSESAQTIAEKTAEEISRQLARQASNS